MIRQVKQAYRRGRREPGGGRSAFPVSEHLARLLLLAILCLSANVFGKGKEEASELVARANRLYGSEKYDKAELLYKDAQRLLPESPGVNFNLGNVAYREGNYDEADEYYSKAMESPDASWRLRKKALYNLGNCAFKKGDKLLDSDLQKALDSYRLSILRYQDVISRDEFETVESGGKEDKTEQDARFNIGVARLKIKDILDKLQQQEQQRKEQQKQQEEFIKKLQEAIQKQDEVVKDTGEAEESQKKGEDVSQSVDEIAKKQTENKERTSELTKQLGQMMQAQQSQPSAHSQSPPSVDENAQAAQESLKNAEIEQGTALQHLDKENLSEAKGGEEAALENLQDALRKLTKPQSRPPAGQPQPQQEGEQKQKGEKEQQQQEQEKKQGQKTGEDEKKMTPEEAQEELAKLRKQTSEARREMLEELQQRYPQYRPERREYEPVDKDW